MPETLADGGFLASGTAPRMPTVDEFVAAHPDLKREGGGYAGPCPVCDGDDRFHVKEGRDGAALWGCRSCIDGATGTARKEATAKVMQELFADRPMPAGARKGNGRSTVAEEQPKTREGLGNVLGAMGYQWRYNVRGMCAELRQGVGDWDPTNDRRIADIRSRIPERFKQAGTNKRLLFGRTAFEDCFLALLNRAESDPFKDWLEALPKWHGEHRLDSWLSHVFEIDDEHKALAAWGSRSLLLGAVWRTYEPGTKIDEMLVLIGRQGIGKSTAPKCLLPPEHPEWFTDGLRLSADDKVRAEALQQRVIVEAAEMAGSTRAERESLKSFLSRTDDGAVRLAWRHDPEVALRRCVLIGTSNDPHCLPADPSGNRRFVAVTVRAGEDGATGVRLYLKNFREQLWAEALHRYREGETAHLPSDLAEIQTRVNASAVQVDESLEDALLAFLDARIEADGWFRIKHDVRPVIQARLAGGEAPSDKRLSVELQRLGCESHGLKWYRGLRGRWWSNPESG